MFSLFLLLLLSALAEEATDQCEKEQCGQIFEGKTGPTEHWPVVKDASRCNPENARGVGEKARPPSGDGWGAEECKDLVSRGPTVLEPSYSSEAQHNEQGSFISWRHSSRPVSCLSWRRSGQTQENRNSGDPGEFLLLTTSAELPSDLEQVGRPVQLGGSRLHFCLYKGSTCEWRVALSKQ